MHQSSAAVARRSPMSARLAAVVAGVLAVTMLPASPAVAAKVKVDRRLFGVHDSDATLASWPAINPGSIRLWDSGTNWYDIEPNRDDYRWDRLDQIVGAANNRAAEVTLVLGQTPAWADDPASIGVGPQYAPVMADYLDYVRAVATRYKGRIKAYQVWNEANVVNYWAQNPHNTPLRMAQMTSAAYGVIKSIDPSAIVVGPAFATRLSSQRTYLRTFFRARVGGTPVWRRMDAISLNLYPMASGRPETSMTLLRNARSALRLGGVPSGKPIWNSEINYGLASGGSGSSASISRQKQAAYVIRTFLLNAANGVKRVHWYMWDRPQVGNTKMVASDGFTPTLAGKAFGLVGAWMRGGTLVGATRSAKPCAKDRRGTYTCIITKGKEVRRVYWNPSRTVKVRLVKSATYKVGVYGGRTTVKGGSLLKVTGTPVMVRSRS